MTPAQIVHVLRRLAETSLAADTISGKEAEACLAAASLVESDSRIAEADVLNRAADRLCKRIRCAYCGGFASADGVLRVWAHERLQERP